MTTTNTPRQDIYSRITDQIVGALEQGVKPWTQPWNAAHEPDVVSAGVEGAALKFPEAALRLPSYDEVWQGQRRWNGARRLMLTSETSASLAVMRLEPPVLRSDSRVRLDYLDPLARTGCQQCRRCGRELG